MKPALPVRLLVADPQTLFCAAAVSLFKTAAGIGELTWLAIREGLLA